MREIPILFNTEMVQAIDDCSKTQTRRTKGLEVINKEPDKWTHVKSILNESENAYGFYAVFLCSEGVQAQYAFKCPYGTFGDQLWVRETFFLNGGEYVYLADGTCCEQFEQCECSEVGKPKWKPSIHMPKSAARFWLKIVEIRVERLQDIRAVDAESEGVKQLARWPEAVDRKRFKMYGDIFKSDFGEAATFDPIESFFTLWISINGNDSVVRNPWVWCIRFKRIEKGGDVK